MGTRNYFKLIPAVYLILVKNSKILLLKRQNTGYEDGNYSFIAGHVDGNESLTQALIREAKEEAGVTLNPQNIKHVHTMHRHTNNVEDERLDFFFTA